MARPERLVVPDVAMHVRQRGVNREDCFREDADRLVFLSCLRDLAVATGCAIHAYCLMTNHVHLMLTPRDEASCATLMRDLGRHYVPYFNRRHRRTGTLWEGRYRSCLVDSAHYVLGCYRYIERNPTEAGMVASPEQYPWSSYAGNAGLRDDKLLTPHPEYAALAEVPERRHSAYQRLFQVPIEPDLVKALREATFGGYALVGADLKARLQAAGQRTARVKPGPKQVMSEPISADLFVE